MAYSFDLTDQPIGRQLTFLAYSYKNRTPIALAAAGFGKGQANPSCTIALMPPTPLQARERTRRGAGYAVGSLRGRVAPSAPPLTGPAPDDASLATPGAMALRRLANLLARYAPHDGVFPLRLPGVFALRLGRMTSQPVHATLGPSLCIVAEGAKVVMLGSEVLEYDPARMLVFAVDLPVSGQVTRASRRDPFLGFKLDLDPARVAELARRVFPSRQMIAGCTSGKRRMPSSTPRRACWI
jgi:hypothetical protein